MRANRERENMGLRTQVRAADRMGSGRKGAEHVPSNRLDVHYSSKSQEWLTPTDFLERVRRVGPIDLDPSADIGNSVQAKRVLTVKSPGGGGLGTWPKSQLAFSNPPYDRLFLWVDAYIRNVAAGRCQELIALIPARTDTRAFHRGIESCDVALFLRGRMRFLSLPRRGRKAAVMRSAAPFPSVVLYWGNRPGAFWRAFEDMGMTWYAPGARVVTE